MKPGLLDVFYILDNFGSIPSYKLSIYSIQYRECRIPTRWGPPVISWFISLLTFINYILYIPYEPKG